MKTLLAAALLGSLSFAAMARAETPADLNDLQIAHAAYTADVIDIRYAHLALALSSNDTVRAFAKTMISDHEAVNAKALALLAKLGAQPEDNFLSKALNEGAEAKVAELVALKGADFDRAYAANELAYHQAVNGIVNDAFIPNIENADVKALFVEAAVIFKMHEGHAEMMVEAVK
jgi:putative membrane protein